MIRNYFKVAFRSILRQKSFSAINIAGLAIGMAGAILILLWIQNEVSYDQFHSKKDQLYMVYSRTTFDGKIECFSSTPSLLGPGLKNEYPEVKDFARYDWESGRLLSYKDKQLTLNGTITDAAFLKMFSFPLVAGDAATALKGNNSIVITESAAKRIFGNEDPINKIIRIDNEDNFQVTGVLKDLPPNTQFGFEYLLPWKYQEKEGKERPTWWNYNFQTFIELRPNASAKVLNAKIKDIYRRHTKDPDDNEAFLFPSAKWRLWARFENGKAIGGRIETIRLFGVIAAFILLIACINFMNLSTAGSEKRAREVGIRKVSGAPSSYIISQFLLESILIAFFAGFIALALVQVSLPTFNSIIGTRLSVPFEWSLFWISFIGFILFTGILAGSYPAFFISSFHPAQVLKGSFKLPGTAVTPRRVLVVIQFTFAITLICGTMIVKRQIQYAQKRDNGYNKANIVYHPLNGDLEKNYELVRTELLASGAATSVTKTSMSITQSGSSSWGLEWPGKDPNKKIIFDNICADDNFVKTMGLRLLAGRDLDLKNYTTDSTACLLNESASKVMGFKNPIGQIVDKDGIKWRVIGVFKDFIWGSPYQQTSPMFIMGAKGWFQGVNFRISETGNISDNLQKAEQIFKKYNPQFPFTARFADQEYARKFDNELRTAKLSASFTALTILISCLGLFGLATFMAVSRKKEIGIRKVLGASVSTITALLSRDFLKLVFIALIIAVPITWYSMQVWLSGFAYHLSVEWWVFIVAGVAAVLIAFVTVSFQAIKAAIANPVKSLRTE